jgi:hypothetical protein
MAVHSRIGFTLSVYRDSQPHFGGTDQPVMALANYPGACNGFYDSLLRAIGFYRDPEILEPVHFSGCRNRGLSSGIIAHEYGHFIVDSIAGRVVDPRVNEGAADMVAAHIEDSPIHGENVNDCPPEGGPVTLCNSCCQSFVRHLNPEEIGVLETRYRDAATLPCWCFCTSGNAPHCEGTGVSQAFYDLKLAIEANPATPGMGEVEADQLLTDWFFLSSGEFGRNVVPELLIADDVDSDLSNGTPHMAQILDAFVVKHGWPYEPGVDDGTVKVDWVGPTSGPPTEGVDYSVYYNTIPPSVILRTIQSGPDSVAQYVIRRFDAGGVPMDLGAVTADWSAPGSEGPLNIQVRIGSLNDADSPQCRNLYVVDIDRQANDKYSNVRFNLSYDLLGHATAYPAVGTCDGGPNDGLPCRGFGNCPSGTCEQPPGNNPPRGGRIAGTSLFNSGRINAEAVGAGDESPGDLIYDRSPSLFDPGGDLSFQRLDAGSNIDVDFFDRFLSIEEPLGGRVRLGTLRATLVPVEDGWHGAIRLPNGATASGVVAIDDPDDGLNGGAIVSGGDFAGSMVIARMQSFTLPYWDLLTDPLISFASLSGSLTIGSMSSPGAQNPRPRIEIATLTGSLHFQSHQIGSVVINPSGSAAVSTGSIVIDGGVDDVQLRGQFDGNVCGNGFAPGRLVPAGLQIDDCGPNFTVCGAPPATGRYGDVTPPSGNGIVNLDDILYVLGCFGSIGNFPNGDLSPCRGNGICNLDDILAVLGAFSGNSGCHAACE